MQRFYVVWDYSHATLEGQEVKAFLKEKGPDWTRDYKSEIARSEQNFMERFMKRRRVLKLRIRKVKLITPSSLR